MSTKPLPQPRRNDPPRPFGPRPAPKPNGPKAPPRAWMNVKQASHVSGRHEKSILRSLQTGELAGSQSGPGCKWIIRSDDFEDWLARGAPVTPAKRRKFRAF